MAGSTLTLVAPMLLEHVRKTIGESFMKADGRKFPLLAHMTMRKDHDGAGRGYVQRVKHSLHTAVGRDFTIVQNKANGGAFGATIGRARFVIQAAKVEGVQTIERDAIIAAEGNPDETYDVLKDAFDSTFSAMRLRLGEQLVERGFGRVATALTVVSDGFTVDATELNRFREGDDLVAAATETGSALRSATTRLVTNVNPANNKVTLDGDPTALGWVANDTIRRNSDKPATNSERFAITGIYKGWFDPTAPSGGESFHLVDRSTAARDLSGFRTAVTAGTDIAKALIDSWNLMFANGEAPTTVFVCGQQWAKLAADKEAQVNVKDIESGPYKIGFPTIVLLGTNGGACKVIADPFMTSGNFLMGDFDDEKTRPGMFHAGEDLANVDTLGAGENGLLRSATATSYELRTYSFMNTYAQKPHAFLAGTGLGL